VILKSFILLTVLDNKMAYGHSSNNFTLDLRNMSQEQLITHVRSLADISNIRFSSVESVVCHIQQHTDPPGQSIIYESKFSSQ